MSESTSLEERDVPRTPNLPEKLPTLDFSSFPKLPEGSEKEVYERMQKVFEIYQNNPDITLRFQITEEAFNRLQNQKGINGEGYSRIKEVIADDNIEYYLVVSPYTNVQHIKESENPKQEALTLGVSHYSTKTDDETVNFELVRITSDGASEIEARSEVYPRDILRIETINKNEAEKFISTVSELKPIAPKNLEQLAIDILKNDFTSYVAASAYGMWESLQVMQAKTIPYIGLVSSELTHPRAQEGIKKLFEQNIGDGTIAALGFFGSEVFLQTVDILGKKMGKEGLDPKKRLLASLAFGVGVAIYLETTPFLGNTIDIPGDFFGIALGAAAILTGKVIGDRLTKENATRVIGIARSTAEKLNNFSRKFGTSLGKDKKQPNPEDVAMELVEILGSEPK